MFLKKIKKNFPFRIISKNKFDFTDRGGKFKKYEIYNLFNKKEKEILSNEFINYSFSQLGQDLIAIVLAEGKQEGYFVEFGACDGIRHSNTFALEKIFNWNGILAEPSKVWHDSLIKNRNCLIDKRCVYSESDLLMPFFEVQKNKNISHGASSLSRFANNGDWASKLRLENHIEYEVKTISLNDLLEENNAPNKY